MYNHYTIHQYHSVVDIAHAVEKKLMTKQNKMTSNRSGKFDKNKSRKVKRAKTDVMNVVIHSACSAILALSTTFADAPVDMK